MSSVLKDWKLTVSLKKQTLEVFGQAILCGHSQNEACLLWGPHTESVTLF